MAEIRIDYAMMEEMISSLQLASEELSDLAADVQFIVSRLESGVLNGQAGDELSLAMRTSLRGGITELRQKCEETAVDLANVVKHYQAAGGSGRDDLK